MGILNRTRRCELNLDEFAKHAERSGPAEAMRVLLERRLAVPAAPPPVKRSAARKQKLKTRAQLRRLVEHNNPRLRGVLK